MDFHLTGSSPPVSHAASTISSPPADHAREVPGSSSNSGSPVFHTPRIPLSPVIPGEEVTMVDASAIQPISIKLNVEQETTPSFSTNLSSTPGACQSSSARQSPDTFDPSAPMAGNGYSKSAKASQPRNRTSSARELPDTPTPSVPMAGNGYSTSAKACQPRNRTSSEAAPRQSAPIVGTNSTVPAAACKPKQKKHTPIPGLNIIFEAANEAGQSSSSKASQPQKETTIPGLTLLSQTSSGPLPNLLPYISRTKKTSCQAFVDDADEDEEL